MRNAGLILLKIDSGAEGCFRIKSKSVTAIVFEPGIHFPRSLGDIELVDSIVPLLDIAHFFTFMI